MPGSVDEAADLLGATSHRTPPIVPGAGIGARLGSPPYPATTPFSVPCPLDTKPSASPSFQ
jgi:hypothetical protein